MIPFFAYLIPIRRVLYTTNAIESLHMRLRKIVKNRGHFPNNEAATKLLCLAIRNTIAKSGHPAPEWRSAMTEFAILFEGRFGLASE